MKINLENTTVSISKRRKFEYWLLAGFAIIFTVAIFLDIKNFTIYAWDHSIYHILFSAQAAMVGVVLAILALLANVVNSRIYGLSVTRYIMIIRPGLFRHHIVFVVTVMLVAVSWIFLAFDLNNLSVATFFVTITLLIRLILDITEVMYSMEGLEKEIRKYVLSSEDFEYKRNLFKEFTESIMIGDIVVIKRDLTLLKKIIIKTFRSSQKEDIEKIQHEISRIIRIASRVNAASAVDVIDLYLTALKEANQAKIHLDSLEKIYARELLSKISLRNIKDISERGFLLHWQKAELENEALLDKKDRSETIASGLYKWLKKNPQITRDELEPICLDILVEAQQSLDFENNYIDYVAALFNNREERLLKALFGLDEMKNLKPLNSRSNRHNLSRANIFIILYTYYLGYKEDLVKDEEKEFCQQLLKVVGRGFWVTVESDVSGFLQSRDLFLDFLKMLCKYERFREKWYGGFNKSVYGHVVREFFVFNFARLSFDVPTLEKKLKSVMDEGQNIKHGMTGSDIYYTYVKKNDLESYRRFCSVMGGYQNKTKEYQSRVEQEGYERLKIAATNLYREEERHEVFDANRIFTLEQDKHEQRIQSALAVTAEEFCSQFSPLDDEESKFESCHWMPFWESLTAIETGDEGYKNEFVVELNDILFEKIKDNLNLIQIVRNDATVAKFLKQFKNIDVNLLIGYGDFHYDDQDYKEYIKLKEQCKQAKLHRSGIHAAVNSSLIKIAIRNINVKIRLLNQGEIDNEIANGNIMKWNDWLDEQTAVDYLNSKYRIIEIRADIAIKSLDDVIGGGFLFEGFQNN